MKRHILSIVSLTIAMSALKAQAQPTVPAYQSLPWVRTGGPIGGLGYDIRYNFDNLDMWYVTDSKSGLHMSTDNGLTWFVSNTGIVSSTQAGEHIPIFCATVDPINPNIVWIGTQYAGGIYKSTDFGYTWIKKTNGTDEEIASAISFRGFTVDPGNSDIVYAMAEVGSWGWTVDGSRLYGVGGDVVKGVVYKTTDGGENWSQIWWGDNLCRYCWIDPRNTDVLYVSTGIFDRDPANEDIAAGDPGGVGILKSTDGGDTWEIIDQDNGLMNLFVGSLYMHPDNPDILLAGTGSEYAEALVDQQHEGVYRTTNGGDSWTCVIAGQIFGAVEFYDPDPDIAYAVSAGAVYRSEDGGYNWQGFGRPDDTWGPDGIIAGMPIDAQCDPRDPNRIFVNNYLGGNFLSEDGGQTWVLASKGYTGAQVQEVAIVPGQTAKVYAAARSGLFRSLDGGENWAGLAHTSLECGADAFAENMCVAVDPSDENHILSSCAQLNGAMISDDGGQSWYFYTLPYHPTRFRYAPSNPNTVYAAMYPLYSRDEIEQCGKCTSPTYDLNTIQLFISTDSGDNWTQVTPSDTGFAVVALAVHPTDPNTIFISRPNAEMLKSADGGENWEAIGSGLPDLCAMCLAVNPDDPNILFTGMMMGGVYRSQNGGESWTQMCSGLIPEGDILDIAIDPSNTQVVYIGDRDSGVYYSTDGGDHWQPLQEGMTHRRINTLDISDDGSVLYAGIEGDGVYRLGTPAETSVSPELSESIDWILTQNYPNPFNASTMIGYTIPISEMVSLKIYDLRGREVVTLVEERKQSGTYVVEWQAEDLPSGIYILRLAAGKHIETRKLILER